MSRTPLFKCFILLHFVERFCVRNCYSLLDISTFTERLFLSRSRKDCLMKYSFRWIAPGFVFIPFFSTIHYYLLCFVNITANGVTVEGLMLCSSSFFFLVWVGAPSWSDHESFHLMQTFRSQANEWRGISYCVYGLSGGCFFVFCFF